MYQISRGMMVIDSDDVNVNAADACQRERENAAG